MMGSNYAPLWKFASVNPTTQEFKTLLEGSIVDFLPLENIWGYGKADFSENKAWKKSDSYTKFRQGDILVPKVTPTVFHGRTMIAAIEGEIGLATSEVHVLRARENADPRWITYHFLSGQFLDSVKGQVYGVGGLQRISTQYLNSYQVLDTPLLVQQEMADYLDKETAEIDVTVADLDEYISLIDERKRTWIRQKLGEKSYTRIPLKLLFSYISSGTTPKGEKSYTDSLGGVPWVTTSELRETDIHSTKKLVTKEAIANTSSLRVHPAGSVLIAMYGATIGRYGRLAVDATCNQACCVLAKPLGLDMDYFYNALFAFSQDLVQDAVGGGQPNIKQEIVKDFKIPVPSMEEQKKLAEEMEREFSQTDSIISDCQELRDLLIKRKQTLITEVISGKKAI